MKIFYHFVRPYDSGLELKDFLKIIMQYVLHGNEQIKLFHIYTYIIHILKSQKDKLLSLLCSKCSVQNKLSKLQRYLCWTN